MASSDADALRAQIAALSGQISAHRAGTAFASAYAPASSARGRGGIARGRGRGAAYYHRDAYSAAGPSGRGRGYVGGGAGSSQWTAGAGVRNKTLVLNQPAASAAAAPSTTTASSSSSATPSTAPVAPTQSASSASTPANSLPGFVKRKDRGSMSLVTSEKYKKLEAARAAHAVAEPSSKRSPKTPSSSRRGAKRGAMSRSFTSKSKTGRTARPEAKKKGPCVFFTRTGRCKRGLTCTYTHDPEVLALCPRVLSAKGCTRKARGKECLLSHTPNAHRVPHCSFYTRDRTCRNAERKDGKGCPYTHSDAVSPDTAPCEQFSELGYCERGQACEARHTFQCDEFTSTGKCSKPKCRLLHIVSAAKRDSDDPGRGVSTGAGDGDDFIFERDDAAAFEDADELENDDGQSSVRKRKRTAEDTGEADAELLATRPRKKRDGKSFITQLDYVSFNDLSDDDDDDSDDDDEDDEEEEEADGEGADNGGGEEDEEGSDGDDDGSDDDQDDDDDVNFEDAREEGSEDEASSYV